MPQHYRRGLHADEITSMKSLLVTLPIPIFVNIMISACHLLCSMPSSTSRFLPLLPVNILATIASDYGEESEVSGRRLAVVTLTS